MPMNQDGVRYNQYSMFRTPLQDALRAQTADVRPPVREGDYRGALTAAAFSDPQEEFTALLNGCGVYDLGYRARISLKGEDRVRWMNGMVTNNIRDLAAGHGVYAFLLNPQGRILGDMTAYNMGETIEVETDRSEIEKIIATFDHFIIMDDVEVTDISGGWTKLGVAGPRARAVLNAVGIGVPELQPLQAHVAQCICDCECLQCTAIRGEDTEQESYEIWLDPKDVYKTWQALIAAGATPAGSEALEMRRIVAGVPLYGADIRERDLPQETEQMRALNFNKGCYVGQEIVERIRSRGNVHRKFTGFLIEGGAQVGAKLISDDKEVGEITSVAVVRTSSGEQTVALGYIRREVGVPGRNVTIGAMKATVAQLPFDEAALGLSREPLVHAQ
jgi:folate-binding protein YgfZ